MLRHWHTKLTTKNMIHDCIWVRAKLLLRNFLRLLINYKNGFRAQLIKFWIPEWVQGHEKHLIPEDWEQRCFWELEKRVVWTHIRGKKSGSKHKSDEILGTKQNRRGWAISPSIFTFVHNTSVANGRMVKSRA